MITNIIKIILAISLFLCLADMPYGYYQFVRFVGFIGYLYLAFKHYKENEEMIAVGWVDVQLKYGATVSYVLLSILFQPFFKIALGRQMWNIIDVIVGIGLLISIFMQPKESQP
jgi:hypothetical protein